ncbi:hypothetical protein FE773_06220 [Caminibacter mediatlanticus TB-2]|uniref:Uncharacterized protein n=1 Tax=Caminibacter mediatlanticus TB-2 TaxID=391592 RepID=A0ABX5V9Y1_9BACT|nr:hypothetical protein [Caminibacter mediatlanticus]QCT94789.1 hypothetical protein FE773_06220 [Caminibacter mediatlanticus TB-2]
MKKRYLYFSLITAFFIGCGENSSISDSNIEYSQPNVFQAQQVNVEYKDYTVKVVDDSIVNAKVTAPECNSSIEVGNGEYVLKNCVSKPKYIMAVNGEINGTNIKQTFPLVLNTSYVNNDNNFVVTPLTTLVADANETELEETAKKLGLTKDDLFKDPTLDNNLLDKARKVNAIILSAMSNGVVANKLKFIDTLRDVIKNENDFNVSKISEEVTVKSQQNPALFGLVFINLKSTDTENIINEIEQQQNPKTVQFLGLVFDEKISNANVIIKWADNNETFLDGIETGENGNFIIELDDNQLKELNNSDNINRILLFEATKDHIKLTSTMSVKSLLSSLNFTNKITPSIQPNLIISNITTVESAILDKRGALKDVISYENNATEIKTYYNDKILKAAAIIKDIVDNNNTSLLTQSNVNNTYSFITENIEDPIDVNLSSNIDNADTTVPITELEQNITNNTILNNQLNYVPQISSNNVDQFESAAKLAGNIFYRILAYCPSDSTCDENSIIREYDKITTLPGYYEVQKCTIEGNDTTNWNCEEPIIIKNANFNEGKYSATDDNGIIYTYSLDNNDSIYIPQVCKSYRIYDVTRENLIANEVNSSTQMVLVDSYDIVDMFRRMPKENKDTFQDLIDVVKNNGYTRDKINYALNRFVRDNIKEIKNYFSDSNSSTQCEIQ